MQGFTDGSKREDIFHNLVLFFWDGICVGHEDDKKAHNIFQEFKKHTSFESILTGMF